MKHLKKIPTPKKHHIPLIVVILAAAIASVGLVLTVLQKTSPASAGNLYLTEKSRSAGANQDVTYTVRIFPGTPVDTVTATLTYDPDELTFKSADYKDSPFTVQIPAIKKTGSVMIQAAQFNGAINKDSLFAHVTFTATRGGNHSVDLSAGNAAYAGVATYPSLNGAAQDIEKLTSVDCEGDACTTDTTNKASVAEIPAVNPAVGIGRSLLKASGLSVAAAQRGAPWLIGLIICLIAAIPAAMLVIRHHRLAKSRGVPHKDVVNSEHKDIHP